MYLYYENYVVRHFITFNMTVCLTGGILLNDILLIEYI